MDGTVDSDQAGAWLTLREAADRLGISEKTARRRVKAGRLQGRQVCTQHGPTWQVWVDESTPVATVDGQGTVDGHGGQGTQAGQADQGPALLELIRVVDRLHDENRTLAEAATLWQTRSLVLAAQLEQARSELRALQAPQSAQEGAQEGRRAAEGPEPTTEPSGPPAEPQPAPAPAPIPPRPNGAGWWGRIAAWLMA